MKVLFLSTRCGDGHNAMARAYVQECQNRGIEAEIWDIFGQLAKENKLFNNGYIFAVKYFPKIYNLIWLGMRRKNYTKFSKGYISLLKKVFPLLKQKVDEFKPDVVVSMFVDAGVTVEYMKHVNIFDKEVKHVSVLTDYVACPHFEYNRNSISTIIPHELCVDELLKKDFDKQKLKPFGIPVDERFLQKYNKTAMREQLGLKDKFTVMTMAGGAGIGNTSALIKSLVKADKDIQIVAVCGRNQKAKKKLNKYVAKNNLDNLVVYGFTDKIPQIMAASDLAFTRGGCSAVSECFYAGLPMVFRGGLINNEKLNVQIFNNMGIGDNIKKDKHAGKIAVYYKNNPHLLDEMRQKIEEFVKPQPTKNAIDFLETII